MSDIWQYSERCQSHCSHPLFTANYVITTDILHEPEAMEIADSLCRFSIDKIVEIAAGLCFHREEIKQRAHHITQKPLIVELLLEFSKRTPFHVRRHLGQVLMNNGLWKEALKIDPKG